MTTLDSKNKWVEDKFKGLSLEQKVGQLMVFGAAGPVVSPFVEKMITKYHVGGLRIAEKFFGGSCEARCESKCDYPAYDIDTIDRSTNLSSKRVYCTPKQFAHTINHYRDLALKRDGSVPIHCVYDQEGEGSDLIFGHRFFPYPMGIAASGDKTLAYKVAYYSGLQAHRVGANMIHSPVLDVNTNPLNPEIGPRSYSDDPTVVAEYALEAMRGYMDAGITPTAKHFPGRGASDKDAHFGLPTIDLSFEQLFNEHISPYKTLIENGLPAVMAAFTNYTAFGAEVLPAAANPALINGYLRKALGFQGVITTDNVQMKGLLSRFGLAEAVVRCLNAGCDLVLYRGEAPSCIYIIEQVIRAVRTGEYPESSLDESVKRVLAMRYDMGLHINGGKVDEDLSDTFDAAEIAELERAAAEQTVTVLRNSGQLPVSKNAKVLLIEQAHHFHSFQNTMDAHPGLLHEEMRKYSRNVAECLINESFTQEDERAVLQRVLQNDYDVIVSTSYYNYRSHAVMTGLLQKIKENTDKPIIAVANTPYTNFALPKFITDAVVCFCPSVRAEMDAVARILFGELNSTAKLKVKKL